MKKTVKWVLIILGSLFGLIAIVYIAGSLLPEAHVATKAARFNQPQQTVWETITDFEGSASWISFYDSIQRLPDHEDYQAWVMKGEFGDVPMKVVEFDTSRRMVTEIIDAGLPFGGQWSYELSDTGNGVILKITEEGKIYNPLFRFMSRFVMGYHKTIENYLTDLAKKFGEGVECVDAP